jgi:catechol 2,3-dioxygenase-like lactoylglutathione lyase family enzyme
MDTDTDHQTTEGDLSANVASWVIRVANLDRSLQFYCDVFSCHVVIRMLPSGQTHQQRLSAVNPTGGRDRLDSDSAPTVPAGGIHPLPPPGRPPSAIHACAGAPPTPGSTLLSPGGQRLHQIPCEALVNPTSICCASFHRALC